MKVLLIGGSSNIGKSTVAAALAARLGWKHASTDLLARHPGRPWPKGETPVPPHVANHYLGLANDDLLASVLDHYARLWPAIEQLVRGHVGGQTGERMVIEGSALWPATVADLGLAGVGAIWLTGSDALFRARIRSESRYAETDRHGRRLIDVFLERTLRYNRAMMAEVLSLKLPFIKVGSATRVEDLAQQCLSDAVLLCGRGL